MDTYQSEAQNTLCSGTVFYGTMMHAYECIVSFRNCT